MSIEESLGRIASALEAIRDGKAGPESVKVTPKAKQPVQDAVPGSDVVPGEDAIPGTEDVPNIGAFTTKTSAELRDFVQKFLAKASELDEKDKGTRSQLFVKYIREVVCAKFSPKEPKLLKIPEKEVGKAAQMVYDYATKNSILIG